MAGISTGEPWSTALVYAPIVSFALSILLSLLFRVATGRVVRISSAWAVVVVAYGAWVFCGAMMGRGTGLPFIIGLLLGLPIATLATVIAIGAQITHIVAAVRAAQATPAPSSEAGG